MKLVNNTLNKVKQFSGFSKDEILEIKQKVSDYKEKKIEENELLSIIKEKFSEEYLNFCSEYAKNIDSFLNSYLLNLEQWIFNKSDEFYYLKLEILNEIKVIFNNLYNLKLNTQNTIRFLKDNEYLNNYFSKISDLSEKIKIIQKKIENSIRIIPLQYEDSSYLWLQIQKIINFNFEIITLPENLYVWDEFSDIFDYLKKEIENKSKGSSKKKDKKYTFDFIILYDYISKKDKNLLQFYSEIVYILFLNKIIEEYQKQEFYNIVERKEKIKDLKLFLKPIIKDSIHDGLENIIKEIDNLDKDIDSKEKKSEIIDFNQLIKGKISQFLPILIDSYIRGFENYYERKISEIEESNKIDEFIEKYSEKIEILYEKMKRFYENLTYYEYFLNPFEIILDSLRNSYRIYLDDIYRRKEEFIEYLKTNKNEKLKENIKVFIDKKIEELNKIINEYRDRTVLILTDKFSPLKQINDIIKDYKLKINEIKSNVYIKLNAFKEKDVDQYHIIKEWEDNFNRKKQQTSFLLSQLLTKLYKNFGDLIKKEESLFEEITELRDTNMDNEELPINFALSSYLAEKLTEDELKERIIELKAKLNQLAHEEQLYNKELLNLEGILETKVRIREGIEVSNIQCGVCHKKINFIRENIIKCPFCSGVYHYLCVAFWLSKYNSCPSCQNAFLDPSSNLFENT